MRRGLFLLAFLVPHLLSAADPRPSESWQTGYRGVDATGPHVLGYWRFEPGAVTTDSSARKNDLTLAGAVTHRAGRFGGALQSFAGWPVKDERHAASARSQPALSPSGAFTFELWIKPGPDLTPELSPVLVDKKYVAHTDYQLRLSRAEKSGARQMLLTLGFGDDSATFTSESFTPVIDQWQHLAFTYDAAGEVRFFRNGAPLGRARKPGRGAIAPGRQILSIGDRIGSYYAGFPGLIDEVRLCSGMLEFRPMTIEFRSPRFTWLRMEKAAPLAIAVRNLSKAPAPTSKVVVSLDGRGAQTLSIPTLAPGAAHEFTYAIDTTLRPDTYRLKARLETSGAESFVSEEATELTIAARQPPRLPVLMWGINSADTFTAELARMKDLGFTHCLGGGANYGAIWEAKKPIPPRDPESIAETRRMLDLALAHGFRIAFSLSPGHWLKDRRDLQRVDRTGKPYSREDVNAALPGLADFCFNVGASVAQEFGAFPAWEAALINTETRDSSQVSFSEFDRQAYRAATGAEIPDAVQIKSGVDWRKLPDFPKDRAIPDDHPVRAFYRWWWTVGDGWNALHSAVHRGVHSTGRDDVWTWFDPAIRAPSIAGSGGDVDVLGQWTYTTPDPLRVGVFADELLAMARASSKSAMKMTQLFWYRTQSAPVRKEGHIASPFDDHDPDAAYITISPMHLRSAFWSMISRPVRGLMYHGWQSLVPTESSSGYRYTHPDTKEEFRRLHRDTLAPLGPTLLQLEDRASDVAVLASFTAQMFARRGSYGYSNDEACLTLLHAQLQPRIVHEDELLQRGLDGIKVLVLPDCDVLPVSVVTRIREFQQRGGIVVGDDNLAPALRAEVSLPKFTRTRQADADHATILTNATRFRAALEQKKYVRFADSTNPEVVVRTRAASGSDYVFAINDRREAGPYVGQHRLVLENGLPADAELSVHRPDGSVYDLVAGRPVAATVRDGRLRWPAQLGPCEGRAFLVTPKPIAAAKIEAPLSAKLGTSVAVTFTVTDAQGAPIAATLPTRVALSDSAGRTAEFSGHYAARNGSLTLRFELAPNDTTGAWTLTCTELASGQTARHFLRVEP